MADEPVNICSKYPFFTECFWALKVIVYVKATFLTEQMLHKPVRVSDEPANFWNSGSIKRFITSNSSDDNLLIKFPPLTPKQLGNNKVTKLFISRDFKLFVKVKIKLNKLINF